MKSGSQRYILWLSLLFSVPPQRLIQDFQIRGNNPNPKGGGAPTYYLNKFRRKGRKLDRGKRQKVYFVDLNILLHIIKIYQLNLNEK